MKTNDFSKDEDDYMMTDKVMLSLSAWLGGGGDVKGPCVP